ncbi:MAG: four helix bundle protein [Campylobacterota bacterium]|nr:four helix bundle protein [Campylobacterota bacterium]
MNYDNLPIYKSALDFCVYIEQIVKTFDKYHKYTLGEDLRNSSKEILFLIHRVNVAREKKDILETLVFKCEELKMIIQISKELKLFKSFKQFEHSSKQIVGICKQSQSWYNHYARVS